MRRLMFFISCLFLSAPGLGQAPQKISYQVVIRNGSNVLVISSAVGIQVSIIQGSISGTEVYKEIYNPNPQTNVNGLVTLEIGSGIPVTGSFATIDWSSGPYFIKTEIDPLAGTNYTITGTSQLLSVPYSLYSESAGSIKGGITETDPIFTNHATYGITSTNIRDWSRAYDWEDHRGLYSLVEHAHPYLSLFGGEMGNSNLVSNLNSDLLDGQHGSFYAPSSGSGSYIQNKDSSAQSGNIWISGDSKIDGKVYVNGIQSIFIPNQTVHLSSLIIGNGGASLTTLSPNPELPPGNTGAFNGQYNTFVGIDAGLSNTSGNINTFIGSRAGSANTTGDQNVFVGMNAGYLNTTGGHNVFVGAGAGQDNTTGSWNSFFGTDSGLHNTTASNNSFFGIGAGVTNTTGSANSFFGNSAGENNNADFNCFFGINSGYSNTTGNYNSFFGSESGTYNTNGFRNSFFGRVSGYVNTTGYENTFIGERSGFSNTSGYRNVLIGMLAGNGIVTGNTNTFIGTYAGSDDSQKTDAVNSIALGFGAYTTADNQVVIGNSSIIQTILNGAVGIGYNVEPLLSHFKLAVNGDIYANGTITTSGGKSVDWNTAYSWGNHADLYKPISYAPEWSDIDLNPFAFSSATDGQLLKYSSTTGKWENWTPNYSVNFTETDPTFIAWDKASGISITSSQVSDFQSSVTDNISVLANTIKNGYPTADSIKLSGIAEGAEKNVNADWNATSGDAQILNKPSTPTGNSPGDMQYWDGTTWVMVPAGFPGQFLQFTTLNGPVWTTILPILITSGVSSVTASSAICGGNILTDGGEPITARGVCWSTSPNPTVSDNKTTDGTGIGIFTSLITGLIAGTTYYAKAYVTNLSFTVYGNEVSFSTAY